MLYHSPVLSRIDVGLIRSPGPGLGNLLFPISRALIGQETYGGHFVYPTMRQAKFGTFLRNERDKRIYGDVIRPRSAVDWRIWLRSRRTMVNEVDFTNERDNVTVAYEGLGRYFLDLVGSRLVISNWLQANVREAGAIAEPFDIGVHVRLGDFQPARASGSGFNVRQPMAWYLDALEEARSLVGERKPRIVLFTDGDVAEVSNSLGIQDLEIDASKNALIAMMNMSKARVLVTSRSSFSMWAAFLGDMPAFWEKRFNLDGVFPIRPQRDLFI